MKKLDEPSTIKSIDRADMLSLLLSFPNQLSEAKRITGSFSVPRGYKDFQTIVFAGLGGSAIGGDLVKSYLSDEIRIPISISRSYLLPKFVNEKTLLFISSYSGNTEETLSAYKEGKKKRAKIVAISSGGELEDVARKDSLPFIAIPKGLPPRMGLGYLSICPLIILEKMRLIKGNTDEIAETVKMLDILKRKKLSPEIEFSRNKAKQIAKKIYNKFIIIYGPSDRMEVAVTRLRGELAENSKQISSSHLFPEMNHNEIVGWEYPAKILKDLIVILLRDRADHPRVQRRMEITKEIIKDKGVEIIEVWSEGKSLLARIFSLIYIGDFISFYLAILNGVDPTPVERVSYLKKRLARSK